MAIPKSYSEERQKEGIKVDCEIEKNNLRKKKKTKLFLTQTLIML